MLSPPITGQKDLDTYLFDLHQNVLETGASKVGLLNPSDSNPLVYKYRYIHIKYAIDNVGAGFSDSPINANYYGILNDDLLVESTNFTDYTWYKATNNFGTTYKLYYQTIGGRQIKFNISNSPPGAGWIEEIGEAIDLDKITSSDSISAMFSAYFMPSSLQVPRDTTTGVADFSTVVMKLYGANNNVITTFSPGQTDSDPSFVSDSWRIGNSSTTGNADISYNNITVGSPTLVTDHAEWPIPTAMTASATVIVPIRYKNIYGVITQSGVVIQQLVFADSGTPGTQSATAYLYQWSTVTPGDPNGTSTYTWSSRSNGGYTGTNGWSTILTANPGTANIKLWVATKNLVASLSDLTTTVSWTSGFTKRIASAGDGIQQAVASIYKWDTTIPTISGTATYTWASRSFSPTTATSGWTATIPSAPSVGYTLYEASVNLNESINNATSTINWTTASISPISYSGDAGASGASSRITYARISGNPSPVSGTVTTSGSTSFPPSGSWSLTATWSATDPLPTSTNSLYQADGIYNPTTNQTVWSTPYISSLKVGNLAAVSVNTGALTVQDVLTVGTTGSIKGGQTAYNTGTGFFLGYSGSAYKFSIGNPSTSALTWDGSLLNVQGTGKFFNPSSSYSYVELGVDGNGSSLRLYRTASTLLPPAYMIDTASSGASPTLWVSHTNGDCFYGTSDSGYVVSGYGGTSNSISTPVAYFQGSRQQAQLEVRGNQQAGSTSAHAGRFKIMVGSTIRSSAICGVDALNGIGGYYCFYAETGTYGPFTGSHDCLVDKTEVIEEGDIVVDVALIYKKDINNTLFSVTKSTQPNQFGIGVLIGTSDLGESDPPAVFLDMVNTQIVDTKYDPEGNFLYNVYEPTVIPEFTEISGNYNYGIMNALGEGQVNVCGENGNISKGDLIVTSSIPGKGMKQSDDIVRSYTVAKARESVTFSSPTEVKQIACIYISG